MSERKKYYLVPDWIDASKHPPENDAIVLGCGSKGGMRVVRCYRPASSGDWNGNQLEAWYTIVGTGKYFTVKYWIPLPKTPYERKDEEGEG